MEVEEGFWNCNKVPKDLGESFAEGHLDAPPPLDTGMKCGGARKETKSMLLALVTFTTIFFS